MQVTQLEAGNQQRLDSLVEKSHSEVTELKFQLIAREVSFIHFLTFSVNAHLNYSTGV